VRAVFHSFWIVSSCFGTRRAGSLIRSPVLYTYGLPNSSGSLAMLAAMRRASSLVNRKRALTDLPERVRAKAIGG
jgi:hypothetical protein